MPSRGLSRAIARVKLAARPLAAKAALLPFSLLNDAEPRLEPRYRASELAARPLAAKAALPFSSLNDAEPRLEPRYRASKTRGSAARRQGGVAPLQFTERCRAAA